MSSLLATAVLAAANLLPTPLPLPLSAGATGEDAQPATVTVAATLSAADGRLRRGCQDYHYAYSVTAGSDDWTFDITLQDRNGKGVNAQSLIGPNDAESGVLPYRLCRWATRAGQFTLNGVLTSYDDTAHQTEVRVTETFTLRRRNR